MKRSENILSILKSRYPLRQAFDRQQRMSANGLINSHCSVYIIENRDAGEELYNMRGDGWADAITVVIDRLNDNILIANSVELGREIENF